MPLKAERSGVKSSLVDVFGNIKLNKTVKKVEFQKNTSGYGYLSLKRSDYNIPPEAIPIIVQVGKTSNPNSDTFGTFKFNDDYIYISVLDYGSTANSPIKVRSESVKGTLYYI